MKLNESILKSIKEGEKTEDGLREFEVTIEETVDEVFFVKAHDMEEAGDIAIEKYEDGEFVLEPGDLTGKQMMVYDPETEESTSWFEF